VAPPSSASIRRYLGLFRHHYPGILSWYSRVEREVPVGRRVVVSVRHAGRTGGLAILRMTTDAKVCHFSIAPWLRGRGIGGALWRASLSLLARSNASTIHVTTSEAVYRSDGQFFAALGFRSTDWNVGRYVRGSSEVVWNFDPEMLWLVRQKMIAERDSLTEACDIGSGHSGRYMMSIARASISSPYSSADGVRPPDTVCSSEPTLDTQPVGLRPTF
jgi:hypothetical protein